MLLHTRFVWLFICFLTHHTYIFDMMCVRMHTNKNEIQVCFLFDSISIFKFFYLSNFLTHFLHFFLFHKNFSWNLWFPNIRKSCIIDIYKLNFILSYQIVILIVYHSCDNIIQLSLDHDDASILLLLAVIIMHIHNLLQMNVFPCADVIFLLSFNHL